MDEFALRRFASGKCFSCSPLEVGNLISCGGVYHKCSRAVLLAFEECCFDTHLFKVSFVRASREISSDSRDEFSLSAEFCNADSDICSPSSEVVFAVYYSSGFSNRRILVNSYDVIVAEVSGYGD